MLPTTINRALSIGQKALQPITENYKNETLWLLQKCLNISSDKLFLQLDRPLNKLEKNKFDNFLNRRKNREPLQHILKSIDFYGHTILLKKNVFIPRPETEIFLDILKKEKLTYNQVLEIGTGSGCIPITLELEKLANSILSIDTNIDATQLAKNNALELNCNNIEFQVCDIFKMQHKIKYDLIISNPPYIPLQDIAQLEPEVLFYDPLSALTDYKNGLSFYQFFSNQGSRLLNLNGRMLFEFGGKNQLHQIIDIFSKPYYNHQIFNDLNNEPRFILVRLLK